MKRYIINGKFMADRMQGIVRYSREILNELDKLIDDQLYVELVVPSDAKDLPQFKNIVVRIIGNRKGIAWEQIDLGRYARKQSDMTLVNLCNTSPFFVKPGITVVHDVMYKVKPEYYLKFRNKLSRIWHIIQYHYIFNHEKLIITVSNFSKSEIEKYYPEVKGRIEVVPNGWQHIYSCMPSKDWQKRYPFLKPREYYFSLATLSKNKNGVWIYKAAEQNSDETFAMGGKIYEAEEYKKPDNVHLLGFVSDEDACALMDNCKAFLFPSVYEGFGIPPLEALARGVQVISSNATSLPEVLGNSVHYIDPYNPNVKLNELLATAVDNPESALRKYGWDISAKKLRDILLNFKM